MTSNDPFHPTFGNFRLIWIVEQAFEFFTAHQRIKRILLSILEEQSAVLEILKLLAPEIY